MLSIKSVKNNPLRLLERLGNMVQESGNCLERDLQDSITLEKACVEASELVSKGQKLSGELIIKLNKSFIIPLDREDVGSIAFELQQLLVCIQGALEFLVLSKQGWPLSQEGQQLVNHLVKAITELNLAVSKVKKVEQDCLNMLRCCERVSQTTYEGGRCYREALAKVLLNENQNPFKTIILQEMLREFAKGLEICNRSSDLLKGVILKYG